MPRWPAKESTVDPAEPENGSTKPDDAPGVASDDSTVDNAEVSAPPPAPAHSRDLCAICTPRELDPSTTTFVCEHGTWTFQPEE